MGDPPHLFSYVLIPREMEPHFVQVMILRDLARDLCSPSWTGLYKSASNGVQKNRLRCHSQESRHAGRRGIGTSLGFYQEADSSLRLPARPRRACHGGPAAVTLGMTTKNTPFYRAGTAERETRRVRTLLRLRKSKKKQAVAE